MPSDKAAAPPGCNGTGLRVTILLATYEGARYLPEQLASIAAQEGVDWHLVVSDDGSGDGTKEMLRDFADAAGDGKVRLLAGPGRGAAENFRFLLRAGAEGADYVAFCDQDDVWMLQKLSRAVAALAGMPAGIPGLYAGRTTICDRDLQPRGLSPDPRRPAGFRNALVENIASGNTMVLNRAATELLRAAEAEVQEIVIHDWWAYQLVTGAGGRVIFDPEPVLFYRQHGGNEIGAKLGITALPGRARRLLGGHFRGRNRINARALAASAHRLTEENRDVLTGFERILRAGPGGRVVGLRRIGLYRQSRLSQAALWLAAIFGRL